jgi:hypothetical protein
MKMKKPFSSFYMSTIKTDKDMFLHFLDGYDAEKYIEYVWVEK